MLKKAKIFGVSLTMLASLFVATAHAEQPVGVGNRVQLEPGMHPVVVAPVRSGDLVPNRNGGALYNGTASESAITYTYNNPVMTAPKVFLIWYGSWNSNSTTQAPANKPVARDYFKFTNQFVTDLAASARWNLNTSYYSAINSTTRSYINGGLSIANNLFIPRNDAKYGKTLNQSSILKIATTALNGGTQNNDTIYLVLTSSDIPVSGFNAGNIQFCGWHSAVSSVAPSMKYGFVGDSANATYCQGQTSKSPNGNPGADAMISVLAHEIEEAATDPYITGTVWRDASGMENADKCAWTWGATLPSNISGAVYNWAGTSKTQYLIQQGFKLSGAPSGVGKDTWNGSCSNS